MFKINRKTEYALRGLIYLARRPSDEFIMIKEIGRAVGASPVFLAKIFQQLAAAGLTVSSRGAVGGGVKLARKPERISIKEVLEATEGPICVNLCVIDSRACRRSKTCAAHRLWKRVRSGLDEMLDQATLQDLAAESEF